jgi:hypothetical protein
MRVRVHIRYESPGEDDVASLVSLGRSLTNDPGSVAVHREASDQLVVEFTMPAEAQYRAVPRIDRAVRHHAGNRLDSTIEFPKSAAERERNRRKAERRRKRR